MANRRHWIFVHKQDWKAVDAIIENFYQVGGVDSVQVDESAGNGIIALGIECGWNDLANIISIFKKREIWVM